MSDSVDVEPNGERVGALRFAESVRLIAASAKEHSLTVPVFRSPPRVADVDRTVMREGSRSPVVSIRLVGRPVPAVQADIIDSVLHVNEPSRATAELFRRTAWERLWQTSDLAPVGPVATRRDVSRLGTARVA